MRSWHRYLMVFAVIFLLFLGITGTLIQATDLTAIVSGAPPADPTMVSIEDGLTGPPNYIVRTEADYSANALPSDFDAKRALAIVVPAARRTIGTRPIDYVELRMNGRTPVGIVQAEAAKLQFDAVTGVLLSRAPSDQIAMQPNDSFRDQVKDVHRMSPFFGQSAMWIQLACAVALLSLIATGSLLYFQLLKARRRMKRKALFWSTGDRWRNLHRGVSIIAAAFLIIVALSGAFLAIDNIGGSFYMKRNGLGGPNPNQHDPLMASAASPLADQSGPGMLATTLAAVARDEGTTPFKVIRLRNYGTMHQGIFVTGGGATRQLVYDAATGNRASMTEPGYPETPFPFGWAWHEAVKQVHRGSYLGLTSRMTDLLAGLALIFLSASALVMYGKLYLRRFKMGKRSLFWK